MWDDLLEKCRDKVWLWSGLGLGLLALIACFFLMRPQEAESLTFPEVTSSVSTVAEPIQSEQAEVSQTTEPVLMVDVKGAVKSEGVYELPVGSRVTDAIKAAGGMLPEADKTSVNLAQKLADEAVVYVARQGEEHVSIASSTGATSPSSQPDKVNLNTASLEDLQTISGIGAKRAQDILDYRESRGGFKSLEDLKNVTGIGDKTFEKIASEVTLD